MKVANAPRAPLYPELSAEPASVFRLQKINEIEAFLRTEVENRERLHYSPFSQLNRPNHTIFDPAVTISY